ncbi:PREDICTED: enolase-phosphatase E1-like, partial [Diuraphis noxia]|uniref:enolase-phosphatase E1-like n=1 Tax=Diuraphis noxia TaxID=143948 RepID=UPI0007638F72
MSNNRTKILNMHTKKFIDNMYTDVFYNKPCKVPLVKLTAEDIQNTKLDVLKNEFKGNKRSKADIKYQDNNTSAEVVSSNKRLKLCEDKIDDIKLILSKEGEVNKPPEKVKTLQNASTSKDDAKLMGHKNSKANTKSKENITSTADKISKEDTKFKGNTNSKLDVKSQDKITTKDDNFSKTGQKSQDNDTHTEEESANNKLNLSTDEADLVELVLSRKSEPDTSIKEGKTLENDKTSNDDTMFNGNTNSKFDIKSQD